VVLDFVWPDQKPQQRATRRLSGVGLITNLEKTRPPESIDVLEAQPGLRVARHERITVFDDALMGFQKRSAFQQDRRFGWQLRPWVAPIERFDVAGSCATGLR